MAIFATAEELYDILGQFFEQLRFVEQAYLIHQVGGSIEFVFQRPEARLRWVPEPDSRAHPPFHVVYGPQPDPPLLTFTQDGDTAHRFWLGRVDLQQALARQQVRAKGPLSRAMRLIPHLDTIYPLYRAFLEARGRTDLLEGAEGKRRP
ncbi:MAG: hypothetical protein K6V97_11860 [Actinomycetia bacterium]|nr:hypothetical protein [Actinomycetes bacterium]